MTEGMGRRPRYNADSYDVHSRRWRKLMAWTRRAGATDKVKRHDRRWERHRAKAELRREDGSA